jgi:hypothetical protein
VRKCVDIVLTPSEHAIGSPPAVPASYTLKLFLSSTLWITRMQTACHGKEKGRTERP